jgi:hypothetical protein
LSLEDKNTKGEILSHRIPVAGAAGFLFAVGSCLIFLFGIPVARWFLLGAILVGALVGGILRLWHKKRPVEITDLHDL